MSSKLKLINENGNVLTIDSGNSTQDVDINMEDLSKVKSVDTIADLKAMTTTPPTIWVSGYFSKGDGAFGSHLFEWDSTSSETDNGGTIIKLTSITIGRYKLKYNGSVKLDWFGDTSLETTWENAANTGVQSVEVESNTYTLDGNTIDLSGAKFHSFGPVTVNTNTSITVTNLVP